MAIRKVARMGHPILRKKAEVVPESAISSHEIESLIRDMKDTLIEYNGRGLAAPQIHESVRIFLLFWDFDKGKKPFIQVLINPEIKILTQEKSTYWEGCLSLPGLIGKVSRPRRISVEAYDEKAKRLNFICDGFSATVVQHELDHLNGVLYIDHIEDMKDFSFTEEYDRFLNRDE